MPQLPSGQAQAAATAVGDIFVNGLDLSLSDNVLTVQLGRSEGAGTITKEIDLGPVAQGRSIQAFSGSLDGTRLNVSLTSADGEVYPIVVDLTAIPGRPWRRVADLGTYEDLTTKDPNSVYYWTGLPSREEIFPALVDCLQAQGSAAWQPDSTNSRLTLVHQRTSLDTPAVFDSLTKILLPLDSSFSISADSLQNKITLGYTPDLPSASTATAGILAIATEVQALAGQSSQRAIVPSTLNAVVGSRVSTAQKTNPTSDNVATYAPADIGAMADARIGARFGTDDKYAKVVQSLPPSPAVNDAVILTHTVGSDTAGVYVCQTAGNWTKV